MSALKLFPMLLVGKAILLIICGFMWAGSFYNLSLDKRMVYLYSSIGIILAILLFFSMIRALKFLYNKGETNSIEWLSIATILPILLLLLSNNFASYIFLANYYIGIVASEIVFFKERCLKWKNSKLV